MRVFLLLLMSLILSVNSLSDMCSIMDLTCCDFRPMVQSCFGCELQINQTINMSTIFNKPFIKKLNHCEIKYGSAMCYQYTACQSMSVPCADLTSIALICHNKSTTTSVSLPSTINTLITNCVYSPCSIDNQYWQCSTPGVNFTACKQEYEIISGNQTSFCVNASILQPQCDALFAYRHNYISIIDAGICGNTSHVLIIQYMTVSFIFYDTLIFYDEGNENLTDWNFSDGWCRTSSGPYNQWYCVQDLVAFQQKFCYQIGYGVDIFGEFCNVTSLPTYATDLVGVTLDFKTFYLDNAVSFDAFQCLTQLRQFSLIAQLPFTYYNSLLEALLSAPAIVHLFLSDVAFLEYQFTENILAAMPSLKSVSLYNIYQANYLGLNVLPELVTLDLNSFSICDITLPYTLVQLNLDSLFCNDGIVYDVYNFISLSELKWVSISNVTSTILLTTPIPIPSTFCSIDFCYIEDSNLCTSVADCCYPLRSC